MYLGYYGFDDAKILLMKSDWFAYLREIVWEWAVFGVVLKCARTSLKLSQWGQEKIFNDLKKKKVYYVT